MIDEHDFEVANLLSDFELTHETPEMQAQDLMIALAKGGFFNSDVTAQEKVENIIATHLDLLAHYQSLDK